MHDSKRTGKESEEVNNSTACIVGGRTPSLCSPERDIDDSFIEGQQKGIITLRVGEQKEVRTRMQHRYAI